jgi:O-antigen/teichoic acid export membrane protein
LSLQTPEPTLAPTDPETIREELVELHAEQQTEQQIDEKRSAGKKLESTAVKATVWVVADYGVSMALRVLNSVVLTHLLMPESFGLVTLVSTLVTGISLLSDIGLNSSVIQSPRGDDPVFLNTAWTVQVLRGLGIFVVALLLSWPMSLFYHDPRLIWLLPALALNIVVQAFWSTGLLSMSRHMGVRRVFLLDISTQIFALLVTAGLAYMYRSVWALVIGTVLGSAYKLVLSHFRGLIPGVRNRFCWDPESVQGLIHFGKWILLATAFFFFASQADRLILGKLISFSLLGVYGIAYSVSDIPRAVINAFANRVGFPFIAKMVHLPIKEFRKVFLQYRLLALLAGALMLTLMVFCGGFLVSKMYDHRYSDATWMVPILALGLWHTLMYATTMPALLSLGKSKYGAMGNAAYCFAVILAIPIGFSIWGMPGAVVAVAAGDFPLYLVLVTGASREGVSTWRQDLQATGAFLVMLAVGYGIRRAIFG